MMDRILSFTEQQVAEYLLAKDSLTAFTLQANVAAALMALTVKYAQNHDQMLTLLGIFLKVMEKQSVLAENG